MTTYDAFEALSHRLIHEGTKIRDVRLEITKLRSAYNQYIDLSRDLGRRLERTRRIVALLGPNAFLQVMKADETNVIGEYIETTPSPRQLRDDLVLWQAIEQYLHCVQEATIEDIQAFFVLLDIKKVSRQAIESALKAHSKLFRVRKSGKEKYISLRDSEEES